MDAAGVGAMASSLLGVCCDHPFGPSSEVYKVGGRIFAILAPSIVPATVNLKCDPAHALELRAVYPSITGGYHQDKRHWNTVVLDDSVPDDELDELIRRSYALVVAGLTRAARAQLLGQD